MSETGNHPPSKILVVEDDDTTISIVVRYLEAAGFATAVARDGAAGLTAAKSEAPALVILDRMLPELDGTQICRLLREESDVPIIMLTARGSETERLEGLELGADDYVTKPFSPRELVARVRSVLRRSGPAHRAELATGAPFVVGDIAFDELAREVRVRGELVATTATESQLLLILCRAPGRPFRRSELVDRLNRAGFPVTPRSIDVHVKNLRAKIERDRDRPAIILTVFGVGYRLARPAR